MRRVRTVGVRSLKDRLSSCLREVRSGAILLVTDRGTVIAELRQPSVAQRPLVHDTLEDWARDGRLSLPRRAKVPCPRSLVRLAEGTAAVLLGEERGE